MRLDQAVGRKNTAKAQLREGQANRRAIDGSSDAISTLASRYSDGIDQQLLQAKLLSVNSDQSSSSSSLLC
ncbi:hypothetical protein VTP01DRAFT_2706 [Rhizomucor pusillus]|uniref:uncharacterized protein n=1 Tax=Rhizomucor pusillus TaxID=4840 RepID=UPI003744347C